MEYNKNDVVSSMKNKGDVLCLMCILVICPMLSTIRMSTLTTHLCEVVMTGTHHIEVDRSCDKTEHLKSVLFFSATSTRE